MADNFQTGEEDSDLSAPPIETMGARYGISVAQLGRGAHVQLKSNYLMPSVHGRNGSMEKVDPAISLTPLGGMMPGPNAIAPAIPSGTVGAFLHQPAEDQEFGSGVLDGFPEGCPVPLR
jgi:hypothetical protein